MILEILIFVLFLAIFVLMNGQNQKTVNQKNGNMIQPPPEERQQLCGTARVVKDKALELIHTGCPIDRKATFDDFMPGASPFGEDGFPWEHENALLGEGYTMGNL